MTLTKTIIMGFTISIPRVIPTTWWITFWSHRIPQLLHHHHIGQRKQRVHAPQQWPSPRLLQFAMDVGIVLIVEDAIDGPLQLTLHLRLERPTIAQSKNRIISRTTKLNSIVNLFWELLIQLWILMIGWLGVAVLRPWERLPTFIGSFVKQSRDWV